MALTEVNSKGIKDADIATGDIADDAITSAKIADDAITSALIADDAVVTAAIADDAITSALIADDAVVTAAIADNAITNALMADDAVGVAELSATGTASSSTYLRGDNSWATVSTTDTKSFRNLIINGACLIAQRGTSSTSHGYATVDRLKPYETGTDCGTKTYTQSDVGAGDAYDAGFRKCFKVTTSQAGNTSTASDSFKFWATRLEAQDIACSGWDYTDSNSKLALSFWIKASTADTFVLQLQTSDGTSKKYNIPVPATTSWTKITKIIPGHADLSFDTNTDQGLSISLFIATGSDLAGSVTQESWVASTTAAMSASVINTWIAAGAGSVETTGWQLEVGSAATDFEHRSYAEELFRCQRYLYRIEGGTYDRWGYAYADATNRARAMIFLPTPLRASPTVTTNNFTVNENSGGTTACNYNNNLDAGLCEITYTHGSGVFTVATMYQSFFYGSGGYLNLSAEL